MNITLHAVGKGMPTWVDVGFKEYQKRMPPSCRLHLLEVPMQKRAKNQAIDNLVRKEGESLLQSIPAANRIIALEASGKLWSTSELAKQLQLWMQAGESISLLIGGPDGLSSECLNAAQCHWSLSPLTFPHPLVRVIIAEQLYRAYSLLQNHPYHRA